jgi:hypothetical protein
MKSNSIEKLNGTDFNLLRELGLSTFKKSK